MSDHRTTAQLSSSERSVLMDRVVTQVGKLTAAVNAQTAIGDERWASASETHKRIGDRHHAFVSMPLLARLRWLLTGR